MTRLHPDDVEAIALRVAELLRPAAGAYLTVNEYAARYGVGTSTVYEHADDLGAIRIGGTLRLPAEPPAPKDAPEERPVDLADVRTTRRPRRRDRVELLPVARRAA